MHLLYISPFFVGKNAGLLHRCNLMTKPKKGGLLTVISNQITKFQNNKKLVEFVDKMNPAAPSAYAHLHAGQEELAEGERVPDWSGNSRLLSRNWRRENTVCYI